MQGVGELLNVPSMSICKGHALGQQAQVYGAPQQLPPELCASGSAQPPPPTPAPSGGMLHREDTGTAGNLRACPQSGIP